MRKIIQKPVFLSILLILVISSFTSLHIYQIFADNSLSLIKKSGNETSTTTFAMNRMIQGLFTATTENQPISHEAQERTKDKKISNLIIYLMTAMFITGDKSLIILMMIFIGAGMIFRKKITTKIQDREIFRPPDIAFYKWWALKFLTPHQKCMTNRSDLYDINPLGFNGWGTSVSPNIPALCLYETECGFFYV